jgi:hypothetical protein
MQCLSVKMARELDDQIKDNGDVYFKSIFREKLE